MYDVAVALAVLKVHRDCTSEKHRVACYRDVLAEIHSPWLFLELYIYVLLTGSCGVGLRVIYIYIR